ncbi:DNA methyltransferase [Iamia sp.]|uniref:DNA methyltransferase n=1 Tax=Iamia sp. TaxID=2722710 RepID=UPI002C34A21F|nr:DNA methyltransferase [Iamia sp.]HXH58921.1 DNA methyltransferase [Iamia sp.]
MTTPNTLYYGDNLDILRHHIADGSVDLVYLDPPFNSKRDYNVLFKEKSGEASPAQIEAFTDTWAWDSAAERTYNDLVTTAPANVAGMVGALRQFVGSNDMMAYLVMMAARLVELHRVLKPTGSLYLHCDPTASHYLKVVLDTVFGPRNYRNEITWKRTSSHNDPQRYGRIHDVILFYTRGELKTFNRITQDYSGEQLARFKYRDERGPFKAENLTAPHFSATRTVEWRGTHPGPDRQWRFGPDELERLYAEGRILLQRDGRPRKDGLKEYLDDSDGAPLQDVWTDIRMAPTAGERLGYPTQKPLALLERIISASSNPGDVVLDPFCGCGTAVVAAEKLGRCWVGIDVTHLSITLMKQRLTDSFPGIAFDVRGEPADEGSARMLALQDRYQFQWWALSLVHAKPVEGREKKGADRGIDGLITFIDDGTGKPKRCLVQVKSGGVSSATTRDLRGTLEREGAEMALLVTLDAPTPEMRKEAATAGFYTSPGWQRDYPRLQMATIADLMDGRQPAIPYGVLTFAKAPRVKPGSGAQQGTLDIGGTHPAPHGAEA